MFILSGLPHKAGTSQVDASAKVLWFLKRAPKLEIYQESHYFCKFQFNILRLFLFSGRVLKNIASYWISHSSGLMELQSTWWQAMGLDLQDIYSYSIDFPTYLEPFWFGLTCNKQLGKSVFTCEEEIHYLTRANQYKMSIPFVTGALLTEVLLPFNFLLFSIDCWNQVLGIVLCYLS